LSDVARDAQAAVAAAEKIGYPVVLKIVSPDAIHKSEAGGVRTGVHNAAAVRDAFAALRDNLYRYNAGARFDGVRVARQAKDGSDMFIGGKYDPSFGPVVFFGYGGIYVEVFADTASVLCPAGAGEIEEKLRLLKSCRILQGGRYCGLRGDDRARDAPDVRLPADPRAGHQSGPGAGRRFGCRGARRPDPH
jgi:hypothetical protein